MGDVSEHERARAGTESPNCGDCNEAMRRASSGPIVCTCGRVFADCDDLRLPRETPAPVTGVRPRPGLDLPVGSVPEPRRDGQRLRVERESEEVTRVAPLPLDSDNLTGSAKHVRDAVAAWLNPRFVAKGKKRGHVVGDDRDPRIEWIVTQRKGPAAVVIEVAPAAAWSPDVVGGRAVLEAPLTVAELALDRARLERLAAECLALARGEKPSVTYRPAGSLLALRLTLVPDTATPGAP